MATVITYGELADAIHAARPRLGGVRLVTIDGPSGSGKTEFARRLGVALAARGSLALVGLESLYEGWTLEGAWQRLDTAVLEPLAAGSDGGFHPYDWTNQQWSAQWCAIPVSHALLVEGCGSSPRAADSLTSQQIWVEAPPDVAMARGLERPGVVDLARRLRDWQVLEAAHFAEQDTRQRADLRVDGNPLEPLPFDSETAFSTTS